MRKEIVFAILAGSIVGLIVAFGVWKANRALQEDTTTQTEQTTTEDQTQQSSNYELVIDTPTQQQVFTQDSAKVSGLTAPNTYVLVSVGGEDILQVADGDGVFEVDVPLEGGLNEIFVVSFSDSGTANDSVLVAYSSQLEQDSSEEASSEADTKTAMIYMGTVTDLTEDTVQLKDVAGEIKLVSINDSTSYTNISGDDQEDIEFEDVAIGDFVMALGYKNGQDVLEGRRIIVSDPYEPSDFTAYYGTVSENGDDGIMLDTPDDQITIAATRNTTTLYEDNQEATEDFDEIETGSKIIVTAEMADGEFEARSVYILN